MDANQWMVIYLLNECQFFVKKSTHFRFEDTSGYFEGKNMNEFNNGFKARRKLFLNSTATEFDDKWVTLSGRLFLDIGKP